MYAYLDNSATTRTDKRVVEIMDRVFLEDFGNPSSLHKIGFEAEKYVNNALDHFSKLLKCGRRNIIFTSGGTESNNTAIMGTALFKESRGRHVICSSIEHPSVSEPFKFLKNRKWDVEILPVDENGLADPEVLKSMLRPDTVLVSVMHVNNETGAVEPVEALGQIIKENAPECFFHVDDVQGFGKYRLDPNKSGIDFLSASAHKIHGPKGTGLLYVSDRASHIPPLISGGGQQNGFRSGTINVPGIAGFERASELMYEELDENAERLRKLKADLISGLSDIPDLRVNGPDNASPYILSLTVKDVRSEVLLHALEGREVYISAGSACASTKTGGKWRPSPTLSGMGMPKEEQESTVRLSFSRFTGKEELEQALNALKTEIPRLRRFKRR